MYLFNGKHSCLFFFYLCMLVNCTVCMIVVICGKKLFRSDMAFFSYPSDLLNCDNCDL